MKHYNSLGFYILSTCLSILFFAQTSWGAAGCWFEFTCTQTNPSQIEYCQDGKCTIQGGSDAAGNAVGNLFTKKTIPDFVSDTVKYFLSFVTLIAVVYVIYAGFQLMVSGGDEEKAKKTKNIILYVLTGIILMWLAYWLVIIILDAIK